MTNSSSDQNESNNKLPFSFEWRGGFSYLTYLKVTTDVTLTDQWIVVNKKNYILGAFPGCSKTTELALTNIRSLSVSSKINWFDLVFSILFVIVTFISMSFWPLLLTAFFIWRTFNTSICISDHNGNKLQIPTGSKDSANSFVQKVSQVTNQYMEVAATAEYAERLTVRQPLVPTKESNKMKKVFLFASAAVVALAILVVAIQSRGGFENKHVEWVKEGTIPGTNLTMSQVLENKTFFSNVEWKEVQEKDNDLDKFVMYQATFSDQGVKVAIRTVFQVFGEGHFDAVETSSNGEILHTSDWYVFLADMADRYSNGTATKKTVQTKEPTKETAPAVQATVKPAATQASVTSNSQAVRSSEVNLKSFVQWSPPNPDAILPLKLDDEKMSLRVGLDSPNGVKVQVVSDSLKQGWNLQLKTGNGSGSPFDASGDLKKGFSLYVKDYNFDQDTAPEIVVSASDGMLETYVWVFGYNFLFGESGTSPLEPIWYGEGQFDVVLYGNEIMLPVGSQGRFDEYVYSNNTFIKK